MMKLAAAVPTAGKTTLAALLAATGSVHAIEPFLVELNASGLGGLDGGEWDLDGDTQSDFSARLYIDYYSVANARWGRALNGDFSFLFATNGQVANLVSDPSFEIGEVLVGGFAFQSVPGSVTLRSFVTTSTNKGLGNLLTNPQGTVSGPGSGASGVVGFRFRPDDADPRYYYGQAILTVSVNGGSLVAAMTIDGNFNENRGEAILADGSAPIPEPASVATGLSALALGAAGLRRWRKHRLEQVAEA